MSTSPHSSTSTFNPDQYISDVPVTDKEKYEFDKALTDTKVKLFFGKQSGFVGSLVATIEFIWDRTIPTACTNGVFMAWNPEFFFSLTPQSRVTVLAHEAWHIAFQHMMRVGNRDFKIYNYAADYVINGMLDSHDYDMTGFPYLLDRAYDNMTTEEVYDKLMEQVQNGSMLPQNGLDGDFASADDGKDGSGNGSGPDSIMGGMTKEQIRAKAQANIVKAATIAKMSKNAGNLPGEVQEAIDKFLNPKLPWQVILANYFEALTCTEYSFRRPNRRFSDPMLPGRTGANGLEHLVYYLDVSGSVSSEDIIRFNSEVKHIKDTYNPVKLTLVTFDTKIQDIYVFEQDDDFEKIVVTGRGGTDLRCVYEHAKDADPTAIVIFTDLYVSIPKKAPACPLIWICSGHETATVPYGTLIHIENEPT